MRFACGSAIEMELENAEVSRARFSDALRNAAVAQGRSSPP